MRYCVRPNAVSAVDVINAPGGAELTPVTPTAPTFDNAPTKKFKHKVRRSWAIPLRGGSADWQWLADEVFATAPAHDVHALAAVLAEAQRR